MTTTTIQKWGNSAAMRLPAGLLVQYKLGIGAKVSIRRRKDVFEIVPDVDRVPTIAELTARITSDNKHDVVDWGAAVGNEVW
jgi:antitoxin MazE